MRVIQVPVLADNYTYLVIDDESGLTAAVDTPDAAATRNAVKKADVQLAAIFDTHHHWDHSGGNQGLLDRQHLPVYGGKYDVGRIHGLSHPLEENDRVKLGSLTFEILDIPGHTLGHIAYYGHGAVLCGDTLFVGGCGRLFEGTPEMMLDSLTKLKNLPDDTKMYCMHEYTEKNLEFALTLEPTNPALQKKYREVLEKRKKGESTVPSTIGEEKSYNPFLRWDSPELIKHLKKRFPKINTDPVTLFAAIRSLKDSF